MEFDIFGFKIKRKKDEEVKKNSESFAPPPNDDGSILVSSSGIQGTMFLDMDGSVRSEAELVTKYRQMALDPIIDLAVQDIVNEAIVDDSDEDVVTLVLDDIKTTDSIKKKIQAEFEEILKLLEFDKLSYEIFRRWYIDGRLYYHVIIDEEKKGRNGIFELRYIDPRHIKKVKEIEKRKDPRTGVTLERVKDEYYLYNKQGFIKRAGSVTAEEATGVRISKDSIVYCTSGYQAAADTQNGDLILSYLHKAIKPMNQLKSMEDSIIIYRISRAPERRIFYVDVGNLPKPKAEQYLKDIMNRFKNKVVYDATTGEIRDDRKFMTMLEDFWLPRRDGSRGTEISTLPGGQNLGEIEDVMYFQNLLYRSLNVPITRLQPESTFTLGRATEVSRDEVKFSKFVTRLRAKFAILFTRLLERQLLLKKIVDPSEWSDWERSLKYDFAVDNYFEELKELEISRDRINMLRDMDEYIGKYFSHEYIRKYVLKQTEEDIEEIDKQIEDETKEGKHPDSEDGEGETDSSDFGGAFSQQPLPQPTREPLDSRSDDEEQATQQNNRREQLELELIEDLKNFINTPM